MTAEAHRQLENFDKAISILGQLSDSALSDYANKIRVLCEAKDSLVREFAN